MYETTKHVFTTLLVLSVGYYTVVLTVIVKMQTEENNVNIHM